jgi:sugar phosphate isomerase/epimerase
MIDCERVVHEFKGRIFHVHAKDLSIDWEGVYQRGVFSRGMGWQVPRLPGFGDMKWDCFIGALYAVGYDSYISIEHEDRAFEGTEAKVKQGFLISRDVLRPYIH